MFQGEHTQRLVMLSEKTRESSRLGAETSRDANATMLIQGVSTQGLSPEHLSPDFASRNVHGSPGRILNIPHC